MLSMPRVMGCGFCSRSSAAPLVQFSSIRRFNGVAETGIARRRLDGECLEGRRRGIFTCTVEDALVFDGELGGVVVGEELNQRWGYLHRESTVTYCPPIA